MTHLRATLPLAVLFLLLPAGQASAAPARPGGLWAEPLEGSRVLLHWTPGPGALGYWVDVAESAADLEAMRGTFRNQLVEDPRAGAAAVEGLRAGVTYWWRVWAFDAAGGVHAYPEQPFSTPAPGAPYRSLSLTAQPLGPGAARLSWSPAPGATGYWVDVAASLEDLVHMRGSFQNRYAGAATSLTWSGLAPGVSLVWRVWAHNAVGGVHVYPRPFAFALPADPDRAMRLRWVPGSTRKLDQPIGDWDRQLQAPTRNLTETRAGVRGTDLGISFEHRGRMLVLFGDTLGRPGDRDGVALSDDREPQDGLSLAFHTDGRGSFLPITVPGVSLSTFEVPTGGFSDGDAAYAFVSTDHSPTRTMGRAVLARSRDLGRSFERLYDVSTTRFVNCAAVVVPREQLPGIPLAGERFLVVFGSGDYRASSPHLAVVPLERVAERGAWRFLSAPGAPRFTAEEAGARPLFEHPEVGELSATFDPGLGLWLLLYNCATPGGIVLRAAPRPWGPWSPPVVVFDGWRDGAYGQYMHVSWDYKRLDAVHDPGREREWGGCYGPYLIQRFCRSDPRRATLRFLLSVWNPYTVVLMETQVEVP